ncbi:MAG: hypothetical protein V2A70_05945, partial [Candidatus Omnitrophota bacterium]
MDVFKLTFLFRFTSFLILFTFITSSLLPSSAQAQAVFNLPAPGTMVSTSETFDPVLMKGLKVHPDNPLLFDFILDSGDVGAGLVPALNQGRPQGSPLQHEAQKLIKYFLATLTIKEADLWVNLSPYEKDRMINEDLGKTEMGRDMLAQDYLLKQLTASMIYPEKDLGKAFWDRVYTKAREQFGTIDIPVDTFNKVWIVADKAKVFEKNNAAYVVGAHLKVMLDTDYLSASQNVASKGPAQGPARALAGLSAGDGPRAIHFVAASQELAKNIIREIILPEIEKEVNEGKNFATLRQMFYAMILATWYKKALKDALLNQVYTNKAKTGGVLSDDPKMGGKIYAQYLEAYKKGVFNYIKDDVGVVGADPSVRPLPVLHAPENSIPRHYFSGGLQIVPVVENAQVVSAQEMKDMDHAMLLIPVQIQGIVDQAQGGERKLSEPEFFESVESLMFNDDSILDYIYHLFLLVQSTFPSDVEKSAGYLAVIMRDAKKDGFDQLPSIKLLFDRYGSEKVEDILKKLSSDQAQLDTRRSRLNYNNFLLQIEPSVAEAKRVARIAKAPTRVRVWYRDQEVIFKEFFNEYTEHQIVEALLQEKYFINAERYQYSIISGSWLSQGYSGNDLIIEVVDMAMSTDDAQSDAPMNVSRYYFREMFVTGNVLPGMKIDIIIDDHEEIPNVRFLGIRDNVFIRYYAEGADFKTEPSEISIEDVEAFEVYFDDVSQDGVFQSEERKKYIVFNGKEFDAETAFEVLDQWLNAIRAYKDSPRKDIKGFLDLGEWSGDNLLKKDALSQAVAYELPAFLKQHGYAGEIFSFKKGAWRFSWKVSTNKQIGKLFSEASRWSRIVTHSATKISFKINCYPASIPLPFHSPSCNPESFWDNYSSSPES